MFLSSYLLLGGRGIFLTIEEAAKLVTVPFWVPASCVPLHILTNIYLLSLHCSHSCGYDGVLIGISLPTDDAEHLFGVHQPFVYLLW